MVRTGEHHLDEVSFVDVLGGAQPLQDVLVAQVVAEEQDLVVHAEEAAFGELDGGNKRAGRRVRRGETQRTERRRTEA